MLSLVLPKGSLEKATLDLFDAADLTVLRASERDYHASIDDPRIDRVRILRPQEIPTYVERGIFDLGITGRDLITEAGADVVSLGELQYSKVTSNPARIVLAVPQDAPWQSVEDLPDGLRISTEYPELTERFLAEHGVKATVIRSFGATEAKVPDIVDAIVDLTETGSSLRKNGLRILDTLLSSYTELITNAAAYADTEKRAAMEDIALLLRGVIQARGQVLLKLNVTADKLAAVTAMLPGHVLADGDHARQHGHERGGDRGRQARRQHADPRAQGGGRAGHPGDPDLQDRRVAARCGCGAARRASFPSTGRGACCCNSPTGCCRAASAAGSPSAAGSSPARPWPRRPPGRCARRPGSSSTRGARRADRDHGDQLHRVRRCCRSPQDQTFFAVAVDGAEVSFARPGSLLERADRSTGTRG